MQLTYNTQPMTTASVKQELHCAIIRWGVPPPHWPKNAVFLDYCRTITPRPKYEIQRLADRFTQEDFLSKFYFYQ